VRDAVKLALMGFGMGCLVGLGALVLGVVIVYGWGA
jgi:hypothetical protein